ncbi:winged helix-turn-helix transcriptional regulator [Paenibacillus sp. MMS18-CY102]|uniref:winged helix-turn-helix transcriptional regulator n=1 Tax=Paenibacillus sp. MMS18-CY102 TaxID=2682849 RepID=UPI001365A7D9|nr:helix-turn-helix domain-containing protein [Paenibacillus sp. MMS18-CY102]MWC29169.1 transcriptional regulator [Paenibacillus sp. MMS18-CY102]
MAKIDANPCTEECPVKRAMDILDGKWTILIIRDLLSGTKRFGELRYSLGEVSPKVLTQRLRELEEKGLIRKTVYPVLPPKVEYELTEEGQSLRGVIDSLAVWGSLIAAK